VHFVGLYCIVLYCKVTEVWNLKHNCTIYWIVIIIIIIMIIVWTIIVLLNDVGHHVPLISVTVYRFCTLRLLEDEFSKRAFNSQ
jgi:uncharacterized membrane protein